jgi:hypothetical protein
VPSRLTMTSFRSSMGPCVTLAAGGRTHGTVTSSANLSH